MTKSSKNNIEWKRWWIAALCAFFVVVGFGIGYVARRPSVASTQSVREQGDSYTFIHPLLAVNRSNMDRPSSEYAGLAHDVEAYIASAKRAGMLSDASVNFIQYGKSGSFTYNADAAYYPASLLKVVIMVGYYKKSEMDPTILDRQLAYTLDMQSVPSVPHEAPSMLAPGRSYSTSYLIERMIVDSDNGAMEVLHENIGDAYLDKVFASLGILGPTGDGTAYTISSMDYSLFFRVLYNATYLSHENSEKALALLSKVTFKDGLLAGMPPESVVAHKFGEHVEGEGDAITAVELHDCGIAYVDGGPYLLCVMTKGRSLENLEKVIAGISRLVYDKVR